MLKSTERILGKIFLEIFPDTAKKQRVAYESLKVRALKLKFTDLLQNECGDLIMRLYSIINNE